MLLFLKLKLYRIFVTLTIMIILIENCCRCDQGSLDADIPLVDNNDLGSSDEDIASLTYQENGRVTPPRYLNLSAYPGELCNRICVTGQRRLCYFDFTLEHYQAMGVACGKCAQGVEEDCNNPQCIVADGVEKGVMSINRQIPGPAIQVCKDDIVIVDVHNNAQGTAATIHWHGLHMIDTPHMDGVPFVTQCPISFSNSFRYQFYATQAGTQFYHSHAGHHKMNGQYGALIVRQPKDPFSAFYDYDLYEHYILISDWMHPYAEQYYPGLPSTSISTDSVLIKGRGVYTNPKTAERTKVPPTIYYVTPGKRYRFRLINSVSQVCHYQMQIESHSLNIISTDSYAVMPYTCDTLVSNAGERYDFILTANHTKGDFWIRVRGLGSCSTNPIESYALIRYKTIRDDLQIPTFPSYENQYPSKIVLNNPAATCWGGKNDHCITELTALEYDEQLRYAPPDHKFFLSFQNYAVSNKDIFKPGEYHHFLNVISNVTLVGGINNISMAYPDYPLLTQPESIDKSQFCDSSNRPQRCADRRVCSCTHILKVKFNSILELVIVDETQSAGRLHHPFHLHGYRFLVIDIGQHPSGLPMTIPRAKEMERSNLIPRNNNKSPPFKDTVSIPSAGYAVVRLRAINPGFWIIHCHYEWHLASGMGLLLQVGETSEMVKAPKGFPKCGNYLPPVGKTQV